LNAKSLSGPLVRPVHENEYTNIVCLAKFDPNMDWDDNLLCTGILVSNTHVLTAEHCLNSAEDRPIEILLGNHNIQEGVRIYSIWWISFNQWNTIQIGQISNADNDIVIIKVKYY
jgi:V8-like Glu-specific endopeptidase